MARPGKIAIHGAIVICDCAFLSILPQVGVGGWTPNPKKLSVDSVRIADPTRSVAETMMGLAAFGKMCRHMIRKLRVPLIRAASTNSFALSDKNCPRTNRAVLVHAKMPTMKMIGTGPPLRVGLLVL